MTQAKSKAWIAAAIGLSLLFLSVTIQKVWSADFWWQLKTGQWIVQHHAVPTQELFSWTAQGNPLREMRWIYCAAIYEGWAHAGPWLLVLGQSALVALAFLLLIWQSGRELKTPLAVLIIGLALAAGFGRWVMRPELVSYVMAAAYLVMLDLAERNRHWRGIYFLPLLQVLWVNTHTLFLFGPVFAWCFAGTATLQAIVGARKNRPADNRGDPPPSPAASTPLSLPWLLLIVALLTTAGCWVNPYGHSGAMYAIQVYTESGAENATARLIMEMRSPFAIPWAGWTWDLIAAAILVALTGLTFIPVWRGVPLSRLCIWVMGAYLFAMLQRNTGLSAIMGAWVGLRNVAELGTSPAPWAIKLREGRPAAIATVALSLLAILTAWYVATDRYAVRFDLPREFGLGVVEWYQPRGAADFLNETKPKGHLFNVMRDGSYLVWAASDTCPVFIDGRTDAYGPALLDELAKVSGSTWDAFAAARAIDTAVIPNRGYDDIVGALMTSPNWALVHLDSAGLVFVRNTADNQALIAAQKVDPNKFPAKAEADDQPPGWKRAYGGIGRAWSSLGIAESLQIAGASAAARPYLEQAVVKAPWVTRARAGLASIYRAQGLNVEADRLVQGMTKLEHAEVDLRSVRLLMAAGKVQEAIAPAESALAADPANDSLRIVLADLYLQTGQFQRAREGYATALKHGAGSSNELNKLAAASEQLKDWEGAVRAYRASLEINQGQYAVWNMMGADCAQAGDLKSAGGCFENALKIKPDFAPAQRNLEKLKALQTGGGK